jgi:hypothetical protein
MPDKWLMTPEVYSEGVEKAYEFCLSKRQELCLVTILNS